MDVLGNQILKHLFITTSTFRGGKYAWLGPDFSRHRTDRRPIWLWRDRCGICRNRKNPVFCLSGAVCRNNGFSRAKWQKPCLRGSHIDSKKPPKRRLFSFFAFFAGTCAERPCFTVVEQVRAAPFLACRRRLPVAGPRCFALRPEINSAGRVFISAIPTLLFDRARPVEDLCIGPILMWSLSDG